MWQFFLSYANFLLTQNNSVIFSKKKKLPNNQHNTQCHYFEQKKYLSSVYKQLIYATLADYICVIR